MPQLNKGGKYVFGWSKIADDRTVHFPPMVLTEYDLLEEQEIIIFTGAKITGGFCVTNQKMLSASKLHKILDDLPELKIMVPFWPEHSFHIREEVIPGCR